MKVQSLFDIIGSDFYTGVPDSQLKALCNFLMDKYGINSEHHIIAANEGNCTALAAGYHLATGKVPVVYMQKETLLILLLLYLMIKSMLSLLSSQLDGVASLVFMMSLNISIREKLL